MDPWRRPSGLIYDVWHRWQLTPNGSWSGWVSHGRPPDASQQSIDLAMNKNNRLELLSGVQTETEYELWHLTQKAPTNGWMSWQMLAIPNFPDANKPYVLWAVGVNADGRLEAFGLNMDDSSAVQAFQTPGGAWQGWSDWQSLGSPGGGMPDGSALAVGESDDGRLEVFGTGKDCNLWHRWQTTPNNGWSAWTNRGRPAGTTVRGRPFLHGS